jgi:hypothetical protein
VLRLALQPTVRFAVLTAAASVGFLVAAWPLLGAAQEERDFVRVDNEGHMVLRIAGAERGGVDETERADVVNLDLSVMVQDRLRSDVVFEAEPVDLEWAHSIEPRVQSHVTRLGPEFSAIHVACRSSTCRLVLEHSSRLSVSQDRSLMGAVQLVVQELIEADPGSFEPAFLMAAYDQESEIPCIKVFLRRAVAPNQSQAGG